MTQRTQRAQNMTQAERKTARQTHIRRSAQRQKKQKQEKVTERQLSVLEKIVSESRETEDKCSLFGMIDRQAEAIERVHAYNFLLSLSCVGSTISTDTARRRKEAQAEIRETAHTEADILSAGVAKKIDMVSASDMTRDLRRSRKADVVRMETAQEKIDSAIITWTDKNGKMHSKSADNYSAIAQEVFDTIGDGADLFQTAICEIYARAGEGLDAENTQKVLDKHVLIRDENSKAWKLDTRTEAQRVSQAIRKLIEDNRSINPDTKYIYFTEIVKSESGEDKTEAEIVEDIIYHRMRKGYTENVINDYSSEMHNAVPAHVYMTDAQRAQDKIKVDAWLIGKNFLLSAQQKDIIYYRMNGYGLRSITSKIYGTTSDRERREKDYHNIQKQNKRAEDKIKESVWYKELKQAEKQAECFLFMIQAEADTRTEAQRDKDTQTQAEDKARKAQAQAEQAEKNADRAEREAKRIEADKDSTQEEKKSARKKAETARKKAETARKKARKAQESARKAQAQAHKHSAQERREAQAKQEERKTRTEQERAEATQRAQEIRKAHAQAQAQREQDIREAEKAEQERREAGERKAQESARKQKLRERAHKHAQESAQARTEAEKAEARRRAEQIDTQRKAQARAEQEKAEQERREAEKKQAEREKREAENKRISEQVRAFKEAEARRQALIAQRQAKR